MLIFELELIFVFYIFGIRRHTIDPDLHSLSYSLQKNG